MTSPNMYAIYHKQRVLAQHADLIQKDWISIEMLRISGNYE